MTNSLPPMSRTELIELAALDAFGLLDEYDSMLYTRSFHHASAAVQDELVELQAEIVSDESILPSETPPGELRIKVLRRVAEAIDESTGELAPLATIGRRQRFTDHPQSASSLVMTGGSAPYWRAAAFAFAATTLVIAYFWSEATNHGNHIANLALDNMTGAQIERLIGPPFTEFLFDSSVRRFVLSPENSDPNLRAVVYLREDGQAFLVMTGLPEYEGSQYEIALSDDQGQIATLARFPGRNKLSGHKLDATRFASAANLTWTISGPEGVILRSA